MGYEDGDLGLMVANRLRDLQRREHQSARRMQNEVERYLFVRHLDGPENLFGIIDIDVASHREAEESHGFLPVHEQDHPRLSLVFKLPKLPHTHCFQHALLQHGLDRREDEEQPDKIAE